MTAVLLTVLVLTALGCSGCSKPASKDKAKPTAKSAETWSAVRLVDGTQYFGKVVRLDTHFAALNDAYFMTEAAPEIGGTGRIKRVGTEVHRPVAQLIFPADAVLYEQPLKSGSAVLKAIRHFESGNATLTPTPKATVPTGQLVCIVLRSGEVFFGNVTVTGDVTKVTNAHYLRFKNEGAASVGEIRSLSQLVLVPQQTGAIGPTGEMHIPSTSVLYFQALSDESPVEKAMK